jgi:hypothetical protein
LVGLQSSDGTLGSTCRTRSVVGLSVFSYRGPGISFARLGQLGSLIVNVRTAKALGIKIPESILLRADELLR